MDDRLVEKPGVGRKPSAAGHQPVRNTSPTGNFRAARSGQRMSLPGRVRPVTTGCFKAPHLRRLVCGGDSGMVSVLSRPTCDIPLAILAAPKRTVIRPSSEPTAGEIGDRAAPKWNVEYAASIRLLCEPGAAIVPPRPRAPLTELMARFSKLAAAEIAIPKAAADFVLLLQPVSDAGKQTALR